MFRTAVIPHSAARVVRKDIPLLLTCVARSTASNLIRHAQIVIRFKVYAVYQLVSFHFLRFILPFRIEN